MKVGSVGYIRRYRKAISLARLVMNYTDHTLLVGDGAEAFADIWASSIPRQLPQLKLKGNIKHGLAIAASPIFTGISPAARPAVLHTLRREGD